MDSGGPLLQKLAALFGRVTHADPYHGLRIALNGLQFVGQGGRNAGAAEGGKALDLRVIGDRHDAWNDGDSDIRPPCRSDKMLVGIRKNRLICWQKI